MINYDLAATAEGSGSTLAAARGGPPEAPEAAEAPEEATTAKPFREKEPSFCIGIVVARCDVKKE
jgi:hypothetical protein